jgi:hypothetical protein
MWAQLVLDSCSLADSIARSSGHNSVDHFQSALIWICIDISGNSFSFELFQRNEVDEMLDRCTLEVWSIGQSVDRIGCFDVRLTPTGEDNCTCTRLFFDQPWYKWKHPHQVELVAIRNYSLQTATSRTCILESYDPVAKAIEPLLREIDENKITRFT